MPGSLRWAPPLTSDSGPRPPGRSWLKPASLSGLRSFRPARRGAVASAGLRCLAPRSDGGPEVRHPRRPPGTGADAGAGPAGRTVLERLDGRNPDPEGLLGAWRAGPTPFPQPLGALGRRDGPAASGGWPPPGRRGLGQSHQRHSRDRVRVDPTPSSTRRGGVGAQPHLPLGQASCQ